MRNESSVAFNQWTQFLTKINVMVQNEQIKEINARLVELRRCL